MADAATSAGLGLNGSWLERPVIDEAAMRDWCEDLGPEDIAEVLACVPREVDISLREIRQAIDDQDLVLAKRVAHRLKGMASNLGAPRLAQICLEIERTSQSIPVIATQWPNLQQTVNETLQALRAYR